MQVPPVMSVGWKAAPVTSAMQKKGLPALLLHFGREAHVCTVTALQSFNWILERGIFFSLHTLLSRTESLKLVHFFPCKHLYPEQIKDRFADWPLMLWWLLKSLILETEFDSKARKELSEQGKQFLMPLYWYMPNTRHPLCSYHWELCREQFNFSVTH